MLYTYLMDDNTSIGLNVMFRASLYIIDVTFLVALTPSGRQIIPRSTSAANTNMTE